MLKKVKRYELVENITKEDLLKAGFKEGGWDSYILNPKVSYSCVLYKDIELHIEISTSNLYKVSKKFKISLDKLCKTKISVKN